jgi:hypothetical protein
MQNSVMQALHIPSLGLDDFRWKDWFTRIMNLPPLDEHHVMIWISFLGIGWLL